VALDDDAVNRFSSYLGLLQLWGKKISLTTRLEATEVIVYHFLDSLAGVPILTATPSAHVVDLGAGAGLPALPLKFALPGLRVVLVESVRKSFEPPAFRGSRRSGGGERTSAPVPLTIAPTTGPSAALSGPLPTWRGWQPRFSPPADASCSTRGSLIAGNSRRSIRSAKRREQRGSSGRSPCPI
jgi:hypothetical protein